MNVTDRSLAALLCDAAIRQCAGFALYGRGEIPAQYIGAVAVRMSLISEDEKARSSLWALNPQSRRLVLRAGPTYARLVKQGIVEDPALRREWEERQEAARSKRMAALAEAKVLGIGPMGGGALRPAPPPVAERRPRPARSNPRDRIHSIVLDNREALMRPGLRREEAADLIRQAWARDRLPEVEP